MLVNQGSTTCTDGHTYLVKYKSCLVDNCVLHSSSSSIIAQAIPDYKGGTCRLCEPSLLTSDLGAKCCTVSMIHFFSMVQNERERLFVHCGKDADGPIRMMDMGARYGCPGLPGVIGALSVNWTIRMVNPWSLGLALALALLVVAYPRFLLLQLKSDIWIRC